MGHYNPAVTQAAATAALQKEDVDYLPALAAGVVALALFAVTLGGTYVYDDVKVILEDSRVTEPASWHLFWTRKYNDGVDNLYRPLVSMTYAIQWWVHGDTPWAFHLVNILLHAAVSALVAELGRRLINSRAGIIAGLTFAAHPIHVEVIAMIVGRAELMCALGVVGAMVLFAQGALTRRRGLAIYACFIVALLSKEQGMLLPFLLLTLALCRAKRGAEAERRPIQELALALCLTLAAYIVLRESVLGLRFWWERSFLDWSIQPMIRSQPLDRWLIPVALLGRYVALLLFPMKLSIDHGAAVIGPEADWSDPYLFIGAAAIMLWLTLAGVALHRRHRVILFLLVGFALTYGIVGNVISLIGTVFGERLMYLPSVFLVILIALSLARLPRRAGVVVLVLLLVPAALRSITYAQRWNDRLEFYRISLDEQPRSIRLHMLLADELADRGMPEEAKRVARSGRELLPDYFDIWLQSARVALQLNELDEAERFVTRAGELDPVMYMGVYRQVKIAQRAAATQATD